MTKQQATTEAKREAAKHRTQILIVKEGPHADDFATRDKDGESYGYCPRKALSILYRYGEVVGEATP